jgi:hypothetical protein
VALQKLGDHVLADTQGTRLEVSADTDDHAAQRRPPHPVDRQAMEQVFHAVDRQRQQQRKHTSAQPEQSGASQCLPGQGAGVRLHIRDERPPFEKERAEGGGHGTGQGDGEEAARLQLEEEQLDGQQDGGDRCAEGRRHAAGGAGHKQRLALGSGEVERLCQQRPARPAGHDDRALGAERPA